MSKRLKFFFGHLVFSFGIASFIITWIFLVWYPQPLAKAVGVTHIFLMMVAIDVILGPILGLLVYKEGKKTLKFDLTIIILIQLSALVYGLYSIAQGRPVWLVYNVDRFELVRKNEIIDTNIQKAQAQFRTPSWFNPQFAAVEIPKNKEERSKSMFEEIFSGISSAQQPELYVDLVQVKPLMRNKVQNLNELEKFNSKQQVENILRKYPEANAWVPLKANAVDMVVLMDKNSAQVVKIVDLRPWK
ncbi:TfpX/TfpZ family type IV pilin accessory protein [Acinetobacter baumannii]|uniref:TfpX/TfpZ family type IV pilin accessory protein n=1 Tax=Acinetobacter baumannii TaxID=470 RepID=UPI000BBC9B10|nr:TfpX/TfpZ family type IV pilin accessory protein [Acinetobacter baumannii]ELB1532767.1 type IV pilin accessory protein [Acinetobacter baumannii]MDC4303679.1 type IV pilin accessory protein [Acinetobacter baumannii]MDC4849123.1 type IV pilin accessory protein [Acinetobacter baumannii]MDC4986122.1 type IV pilin accessory protein [Acinetobacter baumannii]MDC5274887.1 type IV pilin accessory protein [Acinetobacter baumannii]